MCGYQVKNSFIDGYTVVILTDDATGSEARIVPEIGNNLYRYFSGGNEIVQQPDNLQSLQSERFGATKYGTPILCPPNRIAAGKFVYSGREYKFPLNEPPHHLHGEIAFKPWKVIESGASEQEGAFVTSRIRYADYPEILSYFPHRLTFTVTYRLRGGRLTMNGAIANEGDDDAPFAFGLHPYFSLPYERNENVMLQVPADKEWTVSPLAFVTGEPAVTDFSRKLREGQVSIDDYPELGCSLLSLQQGISSCRILIRERRYAIAYQFDELFPFLTLFRPNWSSSFSLEPYTYVTDGFNSALDPALTGARSIAARETITYETNLWIESL